MALTRTYLREIGITEKDMLESIMTEHNATIELEKERARENTEKQQGVIDSLQEKIKNIPNGGEGNGDEWKEKYNEIKGEFDIFKQNVETEKITATKKAAIVKHLETEGANKNLINLLESKFDLEKIEVEENDIKNWKDIVSPIKEQYPEVFGSVKTEVYKPATPAVNNNDSKTGSVMNDYILSQSGKK